MANNKVSSLLNVNLPEPKRSNFNLGRTNHFSADVGYVIPCYVEEVLPNSYKRLDVKALIQTNATLAPLMSNFKVKIDAFFVPLRLYHRHLSLNNTDVDFSSDFDLHYIISPYRSYIPTLGRTRGSEYTNYGVSPSSLIDYLGILPPGFSAATFSESFRLNAEPFIGYFDIWRNFYANPHDRFVPYRVSNVGFSDNLSTPQFDQLAQPSYKYFDLEDLDKFILRVSSLSVDTSGSPKAVDAMRTFVDNVRDIDSSSATTGAANVFATSVPFYANQRNHTYDGSTLSNPIDTSNGLHFGLLPRTYMDDYFNSRFMNSFVSYMEENSKVVVQNNEFSISQLRVANRVAKFVDKSIFADTRFGSWLKAHFGVRSNIRLDIPQFLGSISSNIVFNDIYSTAQTDINSGSVTNNTALGSRAALGQGFIKNKGSFIEFKASEPGYIMCLFSIIPYVSYSQGIRKMYLKTSFNDLYKPEFDAIGYQDLQRLELDAIGLNYPLTASLTQVNQYDALDVSTFNYSIGKHPAWLEYMTAYDESHGLMAVRGQYGSWINNRPFNIGSYEDSIFDVTYGEDGFVETLSLGTQGTHYLSDPNGSLDTSTYINSDLFNTVFAVNKYFDNFQVDMVFYDKTKQPISKQILPHL